MSGNVLNDLTVLADEVIGPLLCNPENQRGWPRIVQNDMRRHVNELRNLMYQLKGEMTSQVLLPMPAGVETIYQAESRLKESDGEDVDLYLKTNIEGAIIKWTQQVHDLLAQDSYIAFKRTKFPLPSADLEFYQQRLKNLEAIVECRDIFVYQRPLQSHFETFEATEFVEGKHLIRPMLHCIGLLWGNSRYFCSVEKLIPLLREVCNLVIQQNSNCVDPPTIFQGEPDEQLIKIRKSLHILNHFLETYEMNRDKVNTFFPQGVLPVRWSFDFDRVFKRFNIYLKRLKMIENILESTVEILKLEKVEFCGLRGKILSTECMKVLDDYSLRYNYLGNIQYDPADPEDDSFLADYDAHMAVLDDVDRRLASLFSQGLDECHNLEHFFKFFQIIGDLFHRPIIKNELKPKLPRLLDYMHANLDAVKEIFDEEMAKISRGPERPMVDPYLPPVAGMLWWIHKLRRRIQSPMEDFIMFEDPIIESEYALYMKQKTNEMLGYLNVAEDKQFKAWCATVPGICKTHLAKNLIYRDPPFVRNNFSPELVMLLREIRYMKYLEKQGIPQDGLDLYNRNEKLQYDMNRLNRAIAWYNAIREGSHETEVALIEKEISAIDQLLGHGVEELTWNDDFTDWMAEVYTAINTLQERVLTAQNNVKRGLANIATRNDILASHKEFQEILKDNYKLFFNIKDESEEDQLEEETLEEVDESTLDDEEREARAKKLQEIEARREEARLAREERDREKAIKDQIKFERREARRLKREIKEFEKAERQARRAEGEEVDSPAEEVEELDPEELADIEEERREMEEEAFRASRWPAYVKYVDSLVSRQIMKAVQTSLNLFEKQTDLEKGPRVAFMEVIAELRDPDIYFSPSLDVMEEDGLFYTLMEMMKDMFLQTTLFPRIDPIIPIASYEDDLIGEDAMIDLYHEMLKRIENSINDIAQYSSIDKYNAMYDEVAALPSEYLCNGWLKLDLKRLNQAIMNIICKWSNLFKENLKDHVHKSLDDLEEFIAYATKALSVELAEDDYDGLLKVMGVLNEVRAKMDADTDHMFEPLRDIIDVLKEYGVEFPEETYEQLDVLPEKWRNLVKQATVMKNTVAPLQAAQAALIAKRVALINLRLNMYREQFKTKEMFLESCKEPYRSIDKVNQELVGFEDILEGLKKSCGLFDIQPPDEKNLKQCRRELKLIKVREPYGVTESTIKNLMTSLRAVTDLQNPAIKDRHWLELMMAPRHSYVETPSINRTLSKSLDDIMKEFESLEDVAVESNKVKFQIDDDTTLADLLALNLHKYEEEVKTIVDKSVKEAAMEKTLKELETTWAVMEFEYTKHDRTGVKLPRASEELVETLEDNQNQVQNMMSSKFVGFFEMEVTEWQKKLGTADAVIALWFEVQRKWQYLESIFVGSDDIRSQLPEDSARFDTIDKTFKEMLKDIATTPNVIEATNKPNLQENLEELMEHLNKCEKALTIIWNEAIGLSSLLLHILSNGNNPPAVCRHLPKLYDNLAKLVFPSATSKQAIEIISKENEEHVPFKAPCCDCSGKVETWLNRVTDCMRMTLRDILAHSVKSYEEKPRDEWVFDWPAQPALVGTQIWWTSETNQAFEKLEEVGDRQKIMTICTIDVHSRDVVAKLIVAKVESSNAFQWQSQLRHRWDYSIGHCFANICDAQFMYDYEYLGNTPRLVITPLTDRCYITLTQSLHLVMGSAPAGPAGTGKTETTKDLGRALGIMVYVFNCSEQMDYKSCGNIYKGLCQTGAWGCFDEFNRISVEVLSVVSVQVKTVLDAIKAKKKKFDFMGEHITLIATVGMFITMNPGYAGRTELPENLKALFRPCAMVVPDFELICEIMLVAEGFQDARLLARKFITLYTLCRELLSKQDHYDWGLRAIKSVLVVAGSLKRGDRLRPEDQVLMRALRDFNIPKIVTDDMPVFMGLIGDLFPALDVPRKRDMDFEKHLIDGAISMKLQPEPGFILKMVQLVELFAVRHSVFIVGFAGTGKSMVWQCLNRTYYMLKQKPFYNDLDPKAVTNDELFGIINPATREWKDGLFSTIMRDMANMPGDGPKWIVLDGDIDPMWIESLNTLMDDNKVLTLASNERIALTKSMRLLFEIATLRTATPATVSRAGILYINPQDLGWNPFVASWIETARDDESEKAMLTVMFDKYIPSLLESCKKYKKITPLTELQQIQLSCYLLECFLNKTLLPSDCPKEWYEIYFVFAVVWGFGSALFQDQIVDWRNEFSKWFCNEFKQIKFPSTGNVFSFFIDPDTKKFLPWSEKVENFELDPDIPLQITVIEMIQRVLEKPLEKKSGRNFGPPGSKFMIYFVDDMNMPEVDKYGTVQPHTLIRQFMDYKHWYDRQKLTLKDISNCMFVACMNPTAGSFTIDPRLQRHFCTFAVSILVQHLMNPANKYIPVVYRYTEVLVGVALALHTKLSTTFLPTAIKFHYIFNLRDLSNIFQGLLFATGEAIKTPSELLRLWMHEATRVYSDKLVDASDNDTFNKLMFEVIKKNCEDYDENVIMEKPLIFCHFAEGIGDPKYFPIKDWNHIKKLLDESLSAYNDLVATMNLVLFEDAMYHICRRPLLSPLIMDIDSGLNMKAGLKAIGNVFLMTDGQVADERFLVLINDLLASGEIAELFPDEDVENIINGVRGETKATGVPDTRENCWAFFINRVRTLLKVILCFSPVGATLRVRARKFPSLVNCTAIDWFHAWPQEALRSVSKRFIAEVECLPEQLVDPVSGFMSHVHQSVNEMSAIYYQNEKRYNYTTPKTFLEQIALYSKLLNEKTKNLKMMIIRLENGLEKLASCAGDVAVLKVTLAEQEIILKEKNKAAEALIEVVGAESEKVSKEKAFAAEEEKKVKVIEEDVTIKAKICADDLAKAEPALIAAQEALNTLNKNNLTELKSFGSPPEAVVNVCAAVLVLFAKKGKLPKDRSWKGCKLMMAKVDQFLNDLVYYDKENIHPDVVKAVQPYIKNPEFNPGFIMSKSAAAAGLCAWVINIVKFYEVYVVVEPKRRALNAANAELQAARDKLAFLTDQIAELEEKLEELLKAFQEAVNEKMKCQAEADATNATIDLANRLVNGLASEKIRWSATVVDLKESGVMLPGDVLLVTAFISYVGCFMRRYRMLLINNDWIPTLAKTNPKIDTTEGLDPLSMLTDDAMVASWNNEGLPTDTMSTENATILTNSARWPLLIDPQLQGLKWIKQKYGESLVVVRLTQRNYLDRIERGVSNGEIVILENIGETVDAVLDPLLGRVLIRKGKVLKYTNSIYRLEEQLLGEVVKAERPDLESLRSGLTKQQNDFKITLKTLEDDLLKRLSSAGPDILSDSALVINLETTKKTAADIEIKVEEGKKTAVQIDDAREKYRRAAARASLLYFILNDLYKIDPMYQFSLKAYSVVFKDALAKAEQAPELEQRVFNLLDSITFAVFVYTSRGLFERDKLVFLFLITLQILQAEGRVDPLELDFLLKFAVAPDISPYPWLSNQCWGGVIALSKMDAFENLDKDIEGASKRAFCEENLGTKYVEARTPSLEVSYQESNSTTAMFFILSPGVDPLKETLEMCSKEAEFKSVLFALCYFHAVVAERPNPRVPWEDLRYLFGEIMYGGHITDDWDRRLCRTFLLEYMQAELVDGELQLAPGFISPSNTDYVGIMPTLTTIYQMKLLICMGCILMRK
nr:unnamed protein product [Spodoptera littoralis]